MYRQHKSPNQHYMHWDNRNSLDELESLLESDFLDYLDPSLIQDMKKIIHNRKGSSPLRDNMP